MVIPMVAPELAFDFVKESRQAALNEACEGKDSACESVDKMCIYCEALAKQIEVRLRRAFIAGRVSMITREEDGNE